MQRSVTPQQQQMQRQVSAPVFVPQQFHNMQLEHSIVQPHPDYVRQMNTRYALPVDQHSYQRNTGPFSPNTVLSHSQIIRNQQGKPVESQLQQQQQRPANIIFSQQPQHISSLEKRGVSVPVKVSYQGANPREIAFSPNKQSPSPA